jgi:hypothetical protein
VRRDHELAGEEALQRVRDRLQRVSVADDSVRLDAVAVASRQGK